MSLLYGVVDIYVYFSGGLEQIKIMRAYSFRWRRGLNIVPLIHSSQVKMMWYVLANNGVHLVDTAGGWALKQQIQLLGEKLP